MLQNHIAMFIYLPIICQIFKKSYENDKRMKRVHKDTFKKNQERAIRDKERMKDMDKGSIRKTRASQRLTMNNSDYTPARKSQLYSTSDVNMGVKSLLTGDEKDD